MSNKREAILKHVYQWIEHAEEDLRLARYAMTMTSSAPYRLIAYHAQQCAEKYLKAYLVNREVDFPYTHNISLLLEKCSPFVEWINQIQDAAMLTKYAITTRYPGEYETLNKEETLNAISLAEKVSELVRYNLIKEGLSDLV